MAILTTPMISNVSFTVTKDLANALIDYSFTINWSDFDQITNLAYSESVQVVGNDPLKQDVIATAPSPVGGVASGGRPSTQRAGSLKLAWADLDEDPGNDDELALLVTLTPRLPSTHVAESAEVVVSAP